jgi:hypothetical protein
VEGAPQGEKGWIWSERRDLNPRQPRWKRDRGSWDLHGQTFLKSGASCVCGWTHVDPSIPQLFSPIRRRSGRTDRKLCVPAKCLPMIRTCNPTSGDGVCVGEGQDQWFLFGFECQQCHGTPMRLLIRREQNKIRLVGRDPIEVLPVPNEIPKSVGKFFGSAQIAHHAGQTLAGIFLLRTVIEQYWRSLDTVKQLIAQKARATGEEQGEVYQKTLPENFRSQFPSLLDLYRQLSSAMHDANSDAVLFDQCVAKIIKHFKARDLFELR